MSVAGIMYFYGGALVAAHALGLDAGVPTPEPAHALPLTVAMGGAMLVSAFLSTPSGAQPPKKGERGFGRHESAVRAESQASCCADALRRARSYMAGVHIGLLLPLLYAGAAA